MGQTFQTCETNFSKPRTDADTMFSLKIAQDPRLLFRRKKNFFNKTLFLTAFHIRSPISQNRD